MLSQEAIGKSRYHGKIYPLRWGYYSNPQMCMFTFTWLLSVFLSCIMISSVFTGFYHKIIGSLLCLYVVYRFTSLGLSNPGLAMQSYDQYFENQEQLTDQIKNTPHLDDKSQCQEQFHNQTQQNSDPEQISHRTFNQSTPHMLKNPTKTVSNQQHISPFYSFCQKCRIPTKKYTKHCQICQTCIDGFDHHCIWIGKCIGKKNMWQFKQFLCFVFVTLIYALILSIQMSRVQRIA